MSREAATSQGLRERVGAVVIGRNEGPRLLRVLERAKELLDHVIYVDSGSSDGSPDAAAKLGVRVVNLTRPFTAAKGRQAGFEALVTEAPHLDLVQFIDGDCVLQETWLPAGVAFLSANPKVAAISGRRREEFPAATLYNALNDIDWDGTPGPVDYPGGDSLCRVDAVRQIGGWAIDLIAGEDPDFGFRLKDAGWQVHRLGDEMTLHDVNMRSFGAYWKRAVRAGYCFLEVGWRHRHGTGRWWLARVRSAGLYALLLPLAFLGSLTLAAAMKPWWIGLIPATLIALVFARLFLKLFTYAKPRSSSTKIALAYALLNIACKAAVLQGALKRLLFAARGKQAGLIEYKPAPAPSAARSSPPSEPRGASPRSS